MLMMSIEKTYVQNVYNSIASHFNNTRAYQWPGIKDFIDGLEHNSLISDIGCGNGKNMIHPNQTFIGVDFSIELSKICNQKKNEVLAANNVNLPFKSNIVDATISIAVIHHLSEKITREKCIQELIRITRKNGLIFIQVWAYEDKTKKYSSQEAFVDWKLQKSDKVYKRYYHLFIKGELEQLVNKSAKNLQIEIEVINSFVEHGNYIIIFKKL